MQIFSDNVVLIMLKMYHMYICDFFNLKKNTNLSHVKLKSCHIVMTERCSRDIVTCHCHTKCHCYCLYSISIFFY